MKLVDKNALVAEIEKRLNYRVESLRAINDGTFWKEDEFNESLARCAFNAAKNELFELKCFLDTLEVKEVDLIKEVANWKIDHQVYGMDETFYNFAEYFYELGLNAQKEE